MWFEIAHELHEHSLIRLRELAKHVVSRSLWRQPTSSTGNGCKNRTHSNTAEKRLSAPGRQ
jgi:hypothetical protein